MVKVHIPEDRPVPEDTYRAVVDSIEEGESSKGDPQWKVTLEIIEGECKGETVRDRLTFSTASAKRLRVFAKAFGLESVGEVEFVPEDVLGKEVQIEVIHEDYQGQPQAKVSFAGYKKLAPKPKAKREPVGRGLDREPGEDDERTDSLPF